MPDRVRLRLKRIDRVAFVDKGDNPTAHVMIWKRAPEDASKALSFAEARAKMQAERETWQHTDVLHQVMRSIMEDDEMDAPAKKALLDRSIDEFATEMKAAMPAMMKQESGPFARLVAAIGKRLGWSSEQVGQVTQEVGDSEMSKTFDPKSLPAEAQAAFAEMEKRATDAEAKLATPAAGSEKEQTLPTEVTKRLEDAEKRAKDAEERVAKIEMDRRNETFVQKASQWTHLPVKAQVLGPILRKVADGEKLTTEEQAEMDRVLSAANEANRTARLFEEVGSGAEGDGSATSKVNKLAKEAQAANPKLSDAAARAQVYERNPGLMAEVEAEDRERVKARR